MTATWSLPDWADPHRAALSSRLEAAVSDAVPSELAEACIYPLQTGGKRMRPLLALAAAEAVGAVTPAVWAAAVAVELIHTYSLVHDDLPAMDDDDERRGRPTVHRAYDEATAILVGDALLTAAFEVLASVDDPALGMALVRELAHASGHRGMIAGQALDVGMAGPVTTLDQLLAVHRCKTGALIRGAVRMGALAAGADSERLERLTTYGEAIGLAFQLADDVLDADEDAGEDGPPSYVKLLGLAETQQRAHTELARALAAVEDLPGDALAGLARFTVHRDH